MNYTALGNVVNLAARLEGLNNEYAIEFLVSESVYQHHDFTVSDDYRRSRGAKSQITKSFNRSTSTLLTWVVLLHLSGLFGWRGSPETEH